MFVDKVVLVSAKCSSSVVFLSVGYAVIVF